MKFYEDEQGEKYVVGADSVPKKLGSSGDDFLIYKLTPANSGVVTSSKTYQYTIDQILSNKYSKEDYSIIYAGLNYIDVAASPGALTIAYTDTSVTFTCKSSSGTNATFGGIQLHVILAKKDAKAIS